MTCSPSKWHSPLRAAFQKFSPFLTGMAKGSLLGVDAVKLGWMAESMLSWSWIAAILSICSFWTSLSSSILSRMNWNASRGIAHDVEALLLLPLLLDVEVCPTAFALVSIGSPSPWSPSFSSPRRRTCILMMVILLMAEGVDMGLISWGIATPLALKILLRRLRKISLGQEVVLVSSTIVSNMLELMSMKVFSLSSMRKIALHCWL